MKHMYSIGEMAKIHGVPIRTLRYYDAIDLFKPAFVAADSGYRYYSIAQFEQLHTIKYLKFLGLSLEEIRRHLAGRDIEKFLALLKARQAETEKMIANLQSVHNLFTSRISEIETALHYKKIAVPFLRKLPQRLILRMEEESRSAEDWEFSLRKLEQSIGDHPSLFIGKVGFAVAKDNFMKAHYGEYRSVFIIADADDQAAEQSKQADYLEAGLYACIAFRGRRQDAAAYYDLLLKFIATQPYEISGDAIERMLIDESITHDSSLYLTEIQIPLQDKT
ncbi:MAG: MerR family transcriptional regulator [Sporomusaceae bacterium]|nr:MerR family transcriptional regulator [Sporomusaceae bacterium]